jgi:prepilin-type N-terminal cleavage/methylation domain-containing protein/prepilin-type processing-associated H-X9-DG protein
MHMRWGGQARFIGVRARGFTLVEMLVVLAIILIVCAMLLSGAVAARKAARQTLCLTQLHSIGLAVTNYALRYQGVLPMGSWADLPGGANGQTSEAPMSVKGFAGLKGNLADLLGKGPAPLPTVRETLLSYMSTRDAVWRCPNQPEVRLAPGQPVIPFVGSGWVDDDRGFRPGYRFMCTVDLRPFVRGDATQQAWGKKILAGDLLVRNIGGLKQNRLKVFGAAGESSPNIVLAYDNSPAYHSKNETRELHEIAPRERVALTYNMLFLDGHAEQRNFIGRDGFLEQFQGPIRQNSYGAEFETEFAEYFVFPPTQDK